jgi:hypothetical protein
VIEGEGASSGVESTQLLRRDAPQQVSIGEVEGQELTRIRRRREDQVAGHDGWSGAPYVHAFRRRVAADLSKSDRNVFRAPQDLTGRGLEGRDQPEPGLDDHAVAREDERRRRELGGEPAIRVLIDLAADEQLVPQELTGSEAVAGDLVVDARDV